ncbi:hypothetical protein [Streptomyces sp. NPDC051921]|uniref:hypothetical protein n=1 Tax=Streptomyces sp. NPDC051921 TaxID=3155806 RepID=UPI00342B75C1
MKRKIIGSVLALAALASAALFGSRAARATKGAGPGQPCTPHHVRDCPKCPP